MPKKINTIFLAELITNLYENFLQNLILQKTSFCMSVDQKKSKTNAITYGIAIKFIDIEIF